MSNDHGKHEAVEHGASGKRVLATALERDVRVLAEEIGERNLRDAPRQRALANAADYLVDALRATGRQPSLQEFSAGGQETVNIELEIGGGSRGADLIVIGAHYDSARTSPGANDNGTGVAAVLQLARFFSLAAGVSAPAATLRFILFSCEEPPFTRTKQMGSVVYAARCKARGERVTAMLSLETLGSFYDGHRGPDAPFPLNAFSPFVGNFIAIVGNLASRRLVARVARHFRASASTRCLAFAAPGILPGIRSSDHWSFWQEGYEAAMVTDTAPFRYRHYHRPTDRAAIVDFPRLADITLGLAAAVQRLAADPGLPAEPHVVL